MLRFGQKWILPEKRTLSVFKCSNFLPSYWKWIMTYSWKRCRPADRRDRKQWFHKTLCRTVVQLTKKSNKIGVLEKILSKAEGKDTQQEHKVCCRTWILYHLHHLLRHYEELQNRNQQNQTFHFGKKFLKQKFPREISRNFPVTAQEKQVKYVVQFWYSYKIYGHLPHLQFT